MLEAMLLTARLTETCLSSGRFSAVISEKFGALLGKSLLGYFSRLKINAEGEKRGESMDLCEHEPLRL